MKNINIKMNDKGDITNLYNIADNVFYYDEKNNRIIEIIIYSITYEERIVNDEFIRDIRYNGAYLETELFGKYEDCFKYAREKIYQSLDKLLKDLKEGSEEYANS